MALLAGIAPACEDWRVRPTRAEIDLGAIRANVQALSGTVSPSRLCAVVKADAYGHGDVPVAEAALESGATSLAVALVSEGIRLREAGIEAPVLVLSEPAIEDIGEVVRWDLTPTAYRVEFLRAYSRAVSAPAEVHLKIDTGMHRVGAKPELLAELVAAVEPPLVLGGVFTHFPVADEDPGYTNEQIERFFKATVGVDAPLHLANTAGAVLFPAARGDMVRTGLGMYGLHPCPRTRDVVTLRPALALKSAVTFVQRLSAGERPSYGRRRALNRDATVVTVPIGYADGIPRRLSATGGEVLIGGKRRPLAGTVTMDQIVVEVGDDPVGIGDEVVLIGRQGDHEITADEWAEKVETISYEIVCDIGPRVPRQYVG